VLHVVQPGQKHRRTPSGRSVRHPGRNKPWRPPPKSAAEIRWDRYREAIAAPFHRQSHPECDYAGELLDLIADAVYDTNTPQLRPANKDRLFAEFIEPFEAEDGTPVVRTLEQAETALRYLAKRDLVIVDGNTVSSHPRFADLLDITKPLPVTRDDADTVGDDRS
jgi:hypothetical protein